jgi:ATP-binding cassette subfamily F protein uup
LQAQIAGMSDMLADPELYARDPRQFRETTAALAVARDGLATAEDRWLTLEILREELDASDRKP